MITKIRSTMFNDLCRHRLWWARYHLEQGETMTMEKYRDMLEERAQWLSIDGYSEGGMVSILKQTMDWERVL